jgi:uncharacterized protein (TIGR02284 family)
LARKFPLFSLSFIPLTEEKTHWPVKVICLYKIKIINMETITEKSSKTLKDLIIINNDRYEGYKLAAEKTKNSALKETFSKYSEQSMKFSKELENLLPEKKYIPEPLETRNTGKLYRVWMDIKNALNQNNEHSLLSSCEYGEDTAKKTYEDALQKPENISNEILSAIRRQLEELRQAHDKIKSLRDSKKD